MSVPNKDVNKLKNEWERVTAGQWKQALNLKDMTTNDWNLASYLHTSGK